MKLINIYTTSGQLEGEMIKAFLQAQGIQAELYQESIAKTMGLSAGKLGEVNILVPESQVTDALTCLKAMEAGEYESHEDLNHSQDSKPDQPDP